jgi:hypothetical protein
MNAVVCKQSAVAPAGQSRKLFVAAVTAGVAVQSWRGDEE